MGGEVVGGGADELGTTEVVGTEELDGLAAEVAMTADELLLVTPSEALEQATAPIANDTPANTDLMQSSGPSAAALQWAHRRREVGNTMTVVDHHRRGPRYATNAGPQGGRGGN